MSSHIHGERLATLPTFREQIRVKSAPITERLGNHTRRLEALQALFVNARRKPTELYELQCEAPKRRFPDEILRAMIHEGIRAGHITKSQVVAFRASQVIDDLSVFPDVTETEQATYCALMQEVGEAVEAVTVHHGLPTAEHADRMEREVSEAAATMQMHVAIAALKRA
jgi:predicted lipase